MDQGLSANLSLQGEGSRIHLLTEVSKINSRAPYHTVCPSKFIASFQFISKAYKHFKSISILDPLFIYDIVKGNLDIMNTILLALCLVYAFLSLAFGGKIY